MGGGVAGTEGGQRGGEGVRGSGEGGEHPGGEGGGVEGGGADKRGEETEKEVGEEERFVVQFDRESRKAPRTRLEVLLRLVSGETKPENLVRE